MRKLSHKAAVSTLRDIVTEAEANAISGDARLAAEGRRLALLGTIVLQIVSAVPPENFGSIKLANTGKGDANNVDAEIGEAIGGTDDDHDKQDGE